MAASISPAHASAMEVGKAFIQQFYTVLHSRPKYLHRFYTNNSSLTIGEQDGPPSTTVTGQGNIHDLWMTLELEGATAAITSVDAQPSHCQGVVVFVTGELQGRGSRKRTFVQIFYLAVQDKGYYVLNDIFRYMPDVSYVEAPADVAAADVAQPNGYAAAPPQIADGLVQQLAQADIGADIQQGQTAAAASQPEPAQAQAYNEPPLAVPEAALLPPPPPTQQAKQQQQHVAVEERQAPPQPQQQQQQPQPAEAAPPSPAPATEGPPASAEPEPEAAAEEQPAAAAPAEDEPAAPAADEPPPPLEPAVPLTYAQRLKLGAAQASAAPPKPKPAAAPRPAEAAPKPVGGDGPAPLANGQADAGSYPAYPYVANDEALSQSIFVKDLPQDITAQRLADEFARFGTLRNGVRGVNLKAQKDKATFAFIEFESEESARAAVASTNMTIDGSPVKIDEKKPLYMTRGRNRAGEFGRGGRGSDFPGRGYMGGRGDRSGRGGPDFSGGRGRGASRGGYMGARGPPGGDRGGRGRGPPPPGRGVPRAAVPRDGPPEEVPAPQEAASAALVEA